MSSQPLRHWLAAATRCRRQALRPATGLGQVRCINFTAGAEVPLETVDDWTQFQLDRADFKTLGML